MDLLSLTYTSRAVDGLSAGDVDAIHQAALTYNPLDGVTGMLVFNGDSFLQMIEGAESAIDDLLGRLRRDKRHHSIEVRDRRSIEGRFFPNWTMHRLDVSPVAEEGMAKVEAEVGKRLDADMLNVVDRSLAAISRTTATD